MEYRSSNVENFSFLEKNEPHSFNLNESIIDLSFNNKTIYENSKLPGCQNSFHMPKLLIILQEKFILYFLANSTRTNLHTYIAI